MVHVGWFGFSLRLRHYSLWIVCPIQISRNLDNVKYVFVQMCHSPLVSRSIQLEKVTLYNIISIHSGPISRSKVFGCPHYRKVSLKARFPSTTVRNWRVLDRERFRAESKTNQQPSQLSFVVTENQAPMAHCVSLSSLPGLGSKFHLFVFPC